MRRLKSPENWEKMDILRNRSAPTPQSSKFADLYTVSLNRGDVLVQTSVVKGDMTVVRMRGNAPRLSLGQIRAHWRTGSMC